MVNGQAWVIPKGAKNPDVACTFAKTMTATDTWVTTAQARLPAGKAQNLPLTGVSNPLPPDERRRTRVALRQHLPRMDRRGRGSNPRRSPGPAVSSRSARIPARVFPARFA
ncbi:hypothetical protein GA0070216_12024 [Micromonospora matsumotoense]|uniref:Extracellular solute-binding protein n=2 Tax=Micromonospora matsumotoense TaxID=121616 RepID=A0A1C5AMZ8_9ACTN|nr:hypothetical protein GA0070216_12024 [Micromonospora matsumotoense]